MAEIRANLSSSSVQDDTSDDMGSMAEDEEGMTESKRKKGDEEAAEEKDDAKDSEELLDCINRMPLKVYTVSVIQLANQLENCFKYNLFCPELLLHNSRLVDKESLCYVK